MTRAATLAAWLVGACGPPIDDECPSSVVDRGIPAPPFQEDAFTQALTPEVDVLFVLGPTAPEQLDPLVAHVPHLLGYLLGSGLDYHIGVLSTDMSGAEAGHIRQIQGSRYIDPQTPNPQQVFSGMVDVGISSGTRASAGFDAIFHALDTHVAGVNAGFRRASAPVRTLVLSDTDDTSNLSVSDFAAWYDSLTALPSERSFVPIVGDDATRYHQAAFELGKEPAQPDDADSWRRLLERVGVGPSGSHSTFLLTTEPQLHTLQVHVDQPIEGEPGTFATITFEQATYDPDGAITNEDPGLVFEYVEAANAVRFVAFVPVAGSRIRARYIPESYVPPEPADDPPC